MHVNDDGDMPGFRPHVVQGLYQVAGGGERRCVSGSTRSAPRCREAIAQGAKIIVLSDRDSTPKLAPDPVAAARDARSITT